MTAELLRLPALEITQAPGQVMFLLAVDGKQLSRIAAVAQTRRGPDASLVGYQRPQVARHIEQIRRYLDSPGALLPNTLTIAFDATVRFAPLPATSPVPYARFGILSVPADSSWPGHLRPGWIVDGQQRVAAITAAARPSVPVGVAAFIDADPARQREQFLRVNAVHPLPRSLLWELLPFTPGAMAPSLERRRQPAQLVERLNHDPASPLYRMIRTLTNPEGLIKDNSMLRTLGSSISDGALHQFRAQPGQEADLDRMLEVVCSFWAAVRDAFPSAWGLPPRRSRLMHGAGVVALGYLMDEIAAGQASPAREAFAAALGLVSPLCRWTSGTWAYGPGWNAIQNTTRDTEQLANYLLASYSRLSSGRP